MHIHYYICPTPHGVGGLKSTWKDALTFYKKSHPSRGGWIEIEIFQTKDGEEIVPPLTGWVD